MIRLIRVSRTALNLGGLEIRWYALLIVCGMLLAILLAQKREKRYALPQDTTLDIALLCLPSAILGARLYYVLFSLDQYLGQPLWKIFAVWEGGLAVYGGVLTGIAVGWQYARCKKVPFPVLCDLVAPCIALGQAIGRWGNFLNREAYGAIVPKVLEFFPAAVRIGGEWHYATFFYESVWCFGLCIFLLLRERRAGRGRPGDGMLWYMLLYAVERGAVEGLRTDSLMLGPLRISQVLSFALAASVIVCFAVRKKTVRKETEN